MLGRPISPMPSFGGLRESQCPRCHRDVDLPLGELCADCRRAVVRRARRMARRAALLAVAVFGVWVITSLPPDHTVRAVAGVGAVATWGLVYLVVYRAVREWLS